MPDIKDTMTEEPQQAEADKAEEQPKEEMCCDGERTAHDHRKEDPDGKCCVD